LQDVADGLAKELATIGMQGAKRVQIVLTRRTSVGGVPREPGFVLGSMLLTPGVTADYVGYAMHHGMAKTENL